MGIVDLLFALPQALAAAVYLCIEASHRIVERSNKGEAMATKLSVPHPGGGGAAVHEVEEDVLTTTERINKALAVNQKFVVLTLADGNKVAVVATDVISIWEE